MSRTSACPSASAATVDAAAPRIALAQLNPTVGALAANADRILDRMREAAAAGAGLLLCAEHALTGAPLDDLLRRPAFHRQLTEQLERLAAATAGIQLVVSHPLYREGRLFSALSVYGGGGLLFQRCKQVLSEDRRLLEESCFARAADTALSFSWGGRQLALLFGSELEDEAFVAALATCPADAFLLVDARPLVAGETEQIIARYQHFAQARQAPVLGANLLGGQDELIFAGRSLAINADGRLAHQAPAFAEQLAVLELTAGSWKTLSPLAPVTLPACIEEEIYCALQFGIADFFAKNGFSEALIGFSGGIDSALVLALAVDALGAERVRTLMMPSPYTAQMSLDDSRAMIRTLGVRYDEISIAPAMAAFEQMLASQFAGLPVDATEENLQSRIRGTTLMALSNKTGAIVLITSNKSELATGYCTLYGDMAGGLAVIKDVYKTMVFRLARWRNAQSMVIPQNIIDRPPSAELRADQLDSDSLPDYGLLDPLIEAYVERDLDATQLADYGLTADELQRTLALIRRNEYKRAQAVQGLRISARSFGRDRRYPITSHYRD